jgi:alkylation response protein AidB-like acyl-CoA dehydrogenase
MSARYQPSADQVMLAEALGESLASILPVARLRQAHEESAQSWHALRELGVFGIALSEAQGGSGLGAVEEALIAIELGRRAVAPSVLATLGVAAMRPAMPAEEQRVAAGYRRGERVIIVGDPGASQVLVRADSGAALYARPQSLQLIDDTLWSSRLLQAHGLGEPLFEADSNQLLRLRLIDAAALAGLARAALEMAVTYASVREQFGRPIGSYQAVKHHCANMALSARLAGDQVSFAAVALADCRDDAALQVESALFVAGMAALEDAGKNIQVHGGIGFSDEADPHRLLKRARVVIEIAGGLEAALARIAEARAAW